MDMHFKQNLDNSHWDIFKKIKMEHLKAKKYIRRQTFIGKDLNGHVREKGKEGI